MLNRLGGRTLGTTIQVWTDQNHFFDFFPPDFLLPADFFDAEPLDFLTKDLLPTFFDFWTWAGPPPPDDAPPPEVAPPVFELPVKLPERGLLSISVPRIENTRSPETGDTCEAEASRT